MRLLKLINFLSRLKSKSLEEIEKIDGLGKSISAKVWELLTAGTMSDLEQILA